MSCCFFLPCFLLLISLTGSCLSLGHLCNVPSFCRRKCHNIGWMTFLKLCRLALILHLHCVIFHLWPLHIHSQPNHLHHNTFPHSSGQMRVTLSTMYGNNQGSLLAQMHMGLWSLRQWYLLILLCILRLLPLKKSLLFVLASWHSTEEYWSNLQQQHFVWSKMLWMFPI